MDHVALASRPPREPFPTRNVAPARLIGGGLLLILLLGVCPLDALAQEAAQAESAPVAAAPAAPTPGDRAEEIVETPAGELTTVEDQVAGSSDDATGWDRRETLLASLTIFVLAVFLGFELITKVPPTLHTPLMSGSNAISGITLVGALLATGVTSEGWVIPFLGMLAVLMATVNAVGGFAVTHRMLAMFRRK